MQSIGAGKGGIEQLQQNLQPQQGGENITPSGHPKHRRNESWDILSVSNAVYMSSFPLFYALVCAILNSNSSVHLEGCKTDFWYGLVDGAVFASLCLAKTKNSPRLAIHEFLPLID